MENTWKQAAEERQQEIETMKTRLEVESATNQVLLATRQREEFADLERRQEETMRLLEQQHQDSLNRLQAKVENALRLQEAMQLQDSQESLRAILLDCTQVREQSPFQVLPKQDSKEV